MRFTTEQLTRERLFWVALLFYGWAAGMSVFWFLAVYTSSARSDLVTMTMTLYGFAFFVPLVPLFKSKTADGAAKGLLIMSLLVLLLPIVTGGITGDIDSVHLVYMMGFVLSIAYAFGLPLYAAVLSGFFGERRFSSKTLRICLYIGLLGILTMIGGCTFGAGVANNF